MNWVDYLLITLVGVGIGWAIADAWLNNYKK